MYPIQIIKNILGIILIIITGQFMPWWAFSIITFIIGYMAHTKNEALISGFMISFSSWFIVLTYAYINGGNILFTKMSMLLKMNSPMILIIASSILSGIIGITSSWTGLQFNKRGKYD